MKIIKNTLIGAILVGLLGGVNLGSPTHWEYPLPFKGTILEASYIPSIIKSITQIVITLTSPATSNTATVSVNASAAVLVSNGISNSSVLPPDSGWVKGTITNGTTITANRINTSGNVTYMATLVEFGAGFVKSQRCSSVDMADTVTSASDTGFSAVNVGKTILSHTGVTSTVSSGQSLTISNAELTTLDFSDSTHVVVSRGVNSGEVLTGYCFVELK